MTKSDLSIEEVAKVLKERVCPLLHSHGGDLKLDKVEGKTITVSFYGACRFCPSAQETTENLVQGVIRECFADDTIEVILQNELNPELLDMAKAFLKTKR